MDNDALKMVIFYFNDGDIDNDDDFTSFTDECEDCEEAWEYVEFLKTEVKEKVTQILQDFKGTTGADATVADTMDEVCPF